MKPLLTVLAGLLLGGSVQAADVPASLLALDRDGAELLVIDPATLQLRRRIATGVGPHEVVGSADGRYAYVANYGTKTVVGDSISIIDLAVGREVERVDLRPFARPHGLELVDGKLYFTAEQSRSVARLDLATRKVDWAMGTGLDVTHMLDVAADGKTIYATSLMSDAVSTIEVAATGLPKLATVKLGKHPEGLALAPDGKTLWVGQNGTGKIAVLDAATLALQAELEAGRYPARVKFTPDGKFALSVDPTSSELLIIDAAQRRIAKRLHIPGAVLGLLPAADSRTVYVTLAQSGQLAEVDLTAMSVARSADIGQVADGMGWAGPG